TPLLVIIVVCGSVDGKITRIEKGKQDSWFVIEVGLSAEIAGDICFWVDRLIKSSPETAIAYAPPFAVLI
ncbi:MAG: hypothetical protein AAB428_02400, partial [Patescibacteria group bacterium]